MVIALGHAEARRSTLGNHFGTRSDSDCLPTCFGVPLLGMISEWTGKALIPRGAPSCPKMYLPPESLPNLHSTRRRLHLTSALSQKTASSCLLNCPFQHARLAYRRQRSTDCPLQVPDHYKTTRHQVRRHQPISSLHCLLLQNTFVRH